MTSRLRVFPLICQTHTHTHSCHMFEIVTKISGIWPSISHADMTIAEDVIKKSDVPPGPLRFHKDATEVDETSALNQVLDIHTESMICQYVVISAHNVVYL